MLVLAGILTGALAAGAASPDAGESGDLLEIRRKLAAGKTLTDAEIERLMELQHTEAEDVRMVMLPVSVTNRKGRVIRNLTAEDFRVYEDRIRQDIEFFSADAATPISIAFLLDVSGSMRQSGKLEAAKDAIRYFLESLRPQDRFALIGFADEQVSWITDFTDDRGEFLERLAVQEGFGRTALNDAVAATPDLVDARIQGRKAIVLLSDGVDNASRLGDWRAIQLARSVHVPIYAVGFTSVPERLRVEGRTQPHLRLLSTFARETGGALFPVHDPDELKEAAAGIVDELRHQYLIGYHPKPRTWDGRFRRVRLESDTEKWELRTRNGYFATP